MNKTLNIKKLQKNLKIDARGLDIPIGSAEIFIKKATEDAIGQLKNKKIITNQDLEKAIIKELRKYHPDLAYVRQNRDKII